MTVTNITNANQLHQSLDTDIASNTWAGINNIFSTLKANTGRNKIIDPFVNPGGGDWNYIFNVFRSMHDESSALTLAQSFLEQYLLLQKQQKTRIHKGTPLQYLALAYFVLGQIEQARKYHLLAFIEDLLTHVQTHGQNVATLLLTPASISCKQRFRVSDNDLLDLQKYVLGLPATPVSFNPETIYLEWVRDAERNSRLIARSHEERLYKPNLEYLGELKKQAFKDPTGKALELFAFYVFSCVDGFEPILRKTTISFHFDVVVRNLVTAHPLLNNLGDYIGIECKKLNEAVDVAQLNHFALKLRLHGMKCGVIFTKKGLTGNRGTYCGAIIQKIFQKDGIIIFTFSTSQINKLAKGYNLLSLLLREYEDVRFT